MEKPASKDYWCFELGIRSSFRIPSPEVIEEWLGKTFLGYEHSTVLLFACLMLYMTIFAHLTILKHYAFKTRAWDLGIFTQSLWTTLNANRFLYHTCEIFLNPTGSFFGVHFSPILFLVLPFYWLAQTPETLLLLQSFVIALAAVPLYRLARAKAGSRCAGLTFSLAYLLYPGIHAVNWYDFHVQAFLPLFLFCVIYYATKKNWPRYFLFMLLSLMCDEHAAIITIFVGIYIAWTHRTAILSAIKRKDLVAKELFVPSTTMIVGSAWYWFTTWQRNVFFPIRPEAMSTFLGSSNFSILGARSPLEIPLLVVLRPWNAAQALAYNGPLKLLYIFLIFGPLAFLSFKRPSALIPTVPWFTFALMSQTLDHHSIGNQYEAYTVAFVFSAAVFAVGETFQRASSLKGIYPSLRRIALCTLLLFLVSSPLGIVVNLMFSNYSSVYIGRHEMEISDALKLVPQDASILTQDNLFPHVSHRVDAYVVPSRFFYTDIRNIVIDFLNQTIDRVDYILVDSETDPFAANLTLSFLNTKQQFILIACKDNDTIRLYKRQA